MLSKLSTSSKTVGSVQIDSPPIIENFQINLAEEDIRAIQSCVESGPLRPSAFCTLIILGGLIWQGQRSVHNKIIYLHLFQQNNEIRCEKEYVEGQTGDIWPPKLYGHAACMVDATTMLLFGGFSHQTRKSVNSTYLYDTTSRKWTLIDVPQGSCKPGPRTFPCMVKISDSKVAVFGGRDINQTNLEQYYNDVHILDWKKTEWIKYQNRGAEEPKGRSTGGCAYLDGNMIIFGGKTEYFKYTNDMWYYNFDEQKWSEIFPQNVPCPRNATCFAQSSCQIIFFYGGGAEKTEKTYYDEFYAYNFKRKKFAKLELRNKICPLADHSVVFVEKIKSVLLFGV